MGWVISAEGSRYELRQAVRSWGGEWDAAPETGRRWLFRVATVRLPKSYRLSRHPIGDEWAWTP